MLPFALIDKYNVPIPRYTSYPTVPFWKDGLLDNADWKLQIEKAIQYNKTKEGISLYIHLPFCEQLCTYCGCNKRITKNHSVETIYIDALLKEWKMYKTVFGDDIVIRELHLGGGTPTFFSPENLVFLKVQTAINRIQPFEKTKQVTDWAREIGYESVNFDLIYGLPFQTIETIKETIETVIQLQPNRIAFYSYAHVPWTKKSQRAYDENDLPKGKDKYALYELGKQLFTNANYTDVGMDHFALENDGLLISKQNGLLHRNFMGYTTTNTEVLVGLGVSAISDVFYGFRQNYKTVEEYYQAINENTIPIHRGINVNDEDILYRKHILNIACKGKTDWKNDFELTSFMKEQLNDLQKDGLVEWNDSQLEVTNLGWSFLRNICAVFDKKMNDNKHQQSTAPQFSQAV